MGRMAELLAQQEARKAAGANQTYPRAAAPRPAAPARPAPKRVALPCVHEGAVLEWCSTCKGGEGRHVRDCDLHERCTRTYVSDKVQSCDRCKDYSTGAAEPPTQFAARPGDPACGVVIGSYGWPALVDLQLRVIRDTCGPVPVCVSSDNPDDDARLAAVCAGHPDAYLWTNARRIGHTGGDLATFWKGVLWGAANGLQVVAKLSQRWVSTRPRWLHDGARALLDSGLPAAIRRCVGSHGFPLRTEAALLDVEAWHRPKVLSRIAPGEYWTRREGGLSAEVVVEELIRDEFGGLYWPWDLVPPVRAEKPAGALWHNSHTRAEYDALARRHGVALPADFHVRGWERERDAGEYRYG